MNTIASYCATKEDEILYEFSEHKHTIPVYAHYCQNFEHSGFIDICENLYQVFERIEPRINRIMSYSMFLHYCNTILQCHLIDRAEENQQMPMGTIANACSYLIPDTLIPAPIYEYISLVSDCITPGGIKVRYNLPNAIIPQGPIEEVESGSFGPVLPENHNAYEVNISPLITARRIQADANQLIDWDPLPPELAPKLSQPTPSLLGFGPAGEVSPYVRESLNYLDFPNDDSLPGRLKICSELNAMVNRTLMTLQNRFRMKVAPAWTKNACLIPPKTSHCNTLFVVCPTPVNAMTRLSLEGVTIRSCSHFSAVYASMENIMVNHRLRNNDAAGHCYIRQNGAPIAGWNSTNNSNFNMIDPFLPIIDANFSTTRMPRFSSFGSACTRKNAINRFNAQFIL